MTLHRLLGVHPQLPRPKYHQHNPLPVDLLIIDEASMIDLALMAQVLDALPTHARLVLLRRSASTRFRGSRRSDARNVHSCAFAVQSLKQHEH